MDICLFWHLSQPYFCFTCFWCIYLFNRYSACWKLLYIYLGRIRDQRIRADFVFISDCLLICFSAFLHRVLFNNFYCPTFIHDLDLEGSLKSFSKCLDKLYRYNRKWQWFQSEIGKTSVPTQKIWIMIQTTESPDHRSGHWKAGPMIAGPGPGHWIGKHCIGKTGYDNELNLG